MSSPFKNGASNGKPDCVRRRVSPGYFARGRPPGEHRQGDARAQRTQRHPGEKVRLSDDYEGRRHRREGNHAQGSARKPWRADDEGSSEQDVGHCWRWHHDGHRAGAGNLSRRCEERHRRGQSYGPQAGHRQIRRSDHQSVERDIQARLRIDDRAGRHHFSEP